MKSKWQIILSVFPEALPRAVVPLVFQEELLFPGGWGALLHPVFQEELLPVFQEELHPIFQEELPADVLEEYLDPA